MSAGRVVAGAAGHAAALLAVYLVTGPLRATSLDPSLGHLAAAAVEASAFVLASLTNVALFLSRLQCRWTVSDALATGLGALLLLAVADAMIAVTLCGVPLTEHFGRFGTVAGMVQALALTFHVAAPALWLAGSDDGETESTRLTLAGKEKRPSEVLLPSMHGEGSPVRAAASTVSRRPLPSPRRLWRSRKL